MWQYFGASLYTEVLALCFAAFALSSVGKIFSVLPWLRKVLGSNGGK